MLLTIAAVVIPQIVRFIQANVITGNGLSVLCTLKMLWMVKLQFKIKKKTLEKSAHTYTFSMKRSECGIATDKRTKKKKK